MKTTKRVSLSALIIAGAVALATVGSTCDTTVSTILDTVIEDPVLDDGYLSEQVETASFAMGCFWGPDSLFGVLPGVLRTRVGYAGGRSDHPTYAAIGEHAETVQIDFDPAVVSYQQLLDVFWTHHDPFSHPFSPQYRSVIFTHDEAQRQAALALLERATAEDGRRPTTDVVAISAFTRAEDDHQKYKLQSAVRLRGVYGELLARFGSFDAFVDSTVAARLNGYAGGAASRERLERVLDALGLSEASKATLLAAIR